MLDAQEWPDHHHAQHPLEDLGREPVDRRDVLEPGVIHEDVQPAVGHDCRLHGAANLILVGDVAADGHRLAPCGSNRPGGLPCPILVEVGEDYPRPSAANVRAISRPMPRAAPVTSETRSSNSPGMVFSSRARGPRPTRKPPLPSRAARWRRYPGKPGDATARPSLGARDDRVVVQRPIPVDGEDVHPGPGRCIRGLRPVERRQG